LTLAFRPLSEAFGLQLCGAGGFTGYFLDFSRGLIGDARNLPVVLPIIHLLTFVGDFQTKSYKKGSAEYDCTQWVNAMRRAMRFSRSMDQIPDIAKFADDAGR
jgi:hypothetical protein